MTHYPITSPLWEDPELGLLKLHFNARARRLVFRAKEDGLHVTLPIGTTSTDLQKAIEELRPRLRETCGKRRAVRIDLNYRVDTDFLQVTKLSLESLIPWRLNMLNGLRFVMKFHGESQYLPLTLF